MAIVDDPILYVNIDTMNRLIASERVRIGSSNGSARTSFPDADPRYPNVTLLCSREVTENAVHRKVWVPAEERYVFHYVGDV